MLQNAYSLAKIGADTAESERTFAEILPKTGNYPTGPPDRSEVRVLFQRISHRAPALSRFAPADAALAAPWSAAATPPGPGLAARRSAKLANFANFCKFLAGSFSAVSKRNFARKYAFDSIFQALQDLHPFAPLQSQNFRNVFQKNSQKIGLKYQQFLWKFSNNFANHYVANFAKI